MEYQFLKGVQCMKTLIRFLVVSILVLTQVSFTQWVQPKTQIKERPTQEPVMVPILTHPQIRSDAAFTKTRSFYKSKSEWRRIIDSTWGPGLPYAEKLFLFNRYADTLKRSFDGFISLGLNWDSLRASYRSRIDSSTSRGIFSGIMTRFAISLRDAHTSAQDTIVLSKPLAHGVPIFILNPLATAGHFGAVLTALPDSTALVLRTIPNHPLGLVPGDIILGYENIPWKRLVRELLDSDLPIMAFGIGALSAETHAYLKSAGNNWHLFDTIDVVKYTTKDTLHLSVLPLQSIAPSTMMSYELLEIPGVTFAQYPKEQVAYGKLPGTNIGYIQLVSEMPMNAADEPFFKAVTALWNTDGLIIDMRWNPGGWALFAKAFALMFNQTLCTIEDALRVSPSTFELKGIGNTSLCAINGNPESLYQRPISVIVGPSCVSMGDLTVQRLRYHPMVRFFGKAPMASLGYNRMVKNQDWSLQLSVGDMFHTSQPGKYLNRSEFPIDEPVWFNSGDVAQGKDPVLSKAKEWISTVSHGYQLALAKITGKYGHDTIKITAKVMNPQHHAISVWSYLNPKENTNLFLDSCQMFDDGLHNDGKAGDSLYGGTILLPSSEGVFGVSLRTTDITAGTFRHLPNVQRYFSNGPIVFKHFLYTTTDTIPNPGDAFRIKFRLGNNGTTDTVRNVIATVSALDTLITLGTVSPISCGDIPPGKDSLAVFRLEVKVKPTCPTPATIRLLLNISSEGTQVWTDTVKILVTPTGVFASDNSIPTEFSLSQNYPNPFNPATTIRYALPSSANVKLSVFDLLGREIATLVNEEQSAGWKEVEWNASSLSSGIYFYKLEAGGFAEVKKLMLLK
jgi:hypothetical protein